MGRPSTGALGSYPEKLKRIIRVLCEEHPTWGAQTIKAEIKKNPAWQEIPLPSVAVINAFLKSEKLLASDRRAKSTFQQDQKSSSTDLDVIKIDFDSFWIIKLIQGKIQYNELVRIFSGRFEIDVIQELHKQIKWGALRCRNRAAVVFAYYKGISKRKIARTLLLTPQSVRKYVRLFDDGGIANLFCWRYKKILKFENADYINLVFEILHTPPIEYDINRTTWRIKDIQQIMSQKGMDLSIGYISKIIKNGGYRVRQAKKVLTSNDPNYKDKIQYIKDILANLGKREKFFSVDEYGPFAIKLQGGRMLMAPGKSKKVPQWQQNKGTVIITAALELSTNQVTHFFSETKDTKEMIKLIEILIHQYKTENKIYISWDAASWHDSKELQGKIDQINNENFRNENGTPEVVLAPLPTCAQFLNVIESVFSGMARAIIHNSDYQSEDDCKRAIDRYFDERNQFFFENPKRAGNKIWGKERVKPEFKESNNCKDPRYRN